MSDYAYTGLTLNGKFNEDGEYFMLFIELNGVPIRFGNLYVGDQRESFQAASDAAPAEAAPAEPSA